MYLSLAVVSMRAELPSGEGADGPGAPPDLAVHPLDAVVVADVPLTLRREARVGQRRGDAGAR